jgi:hypothetical protein
MAGSFLSWFVGLVVPVQEVFVLHWLLWSAQYKIFYFLTVHYFNPVNSLPSKQGRQPCWFTCLLVCVSGNNLSLSASGVGTGSELQGITICTSYAISFFKAVNYRF